MNIPVRPPEGENSRAWPADVDAAVPYWVYTDPAIYAEELQKIWYGPHWLYVGPVSYTHLTLPTNSRV